MIDTTSDSPIAIPAELLGSTATEATRITDGHIHFTWRVADSGGGEWAVQAVNTSVFPDPVALSSNRMSIVSALRDTGSLTLEPVGVGPDELPFMESGGMIWRAARWIEGGPPKVGSVADVRTVAEAFGRFDAALRDRIDLIELIPQFHDLEQRFRQLDSMLAVDPLGRAKESRQVIDRLEGLRESLVGITSRWACLPRTVSHNDAKASNVLINGAGDAVIIDLDTVMATTILNDVGELVRSSLGGVGDRSHGAQIDHDLVAEIVAGFAHGFGALGAEEESLVSSAGLMLSVENAVRFLTDHVAGDSYFAISQGGENLQRAAAQTHLAEMLDAASTRIARAVADALRF